MKNELFRTKNRARSLFPKLFGVSVTLSAALSFAACAKTDAPTGSGETHFLDSCDATCGDGFACLCGVCTKTCDADGECSAHDGAKCLPSACGSSNHVCDLACNGDDDCEAFASGSTCTDGRCRKPASTEHDAGTTDAGGSHPDGGGSHSDAAGAFDHCEVPPPSTCSFEDTCNALGCGGLEFDEQGCHRASCDSDADCGAADRCTSVRCTNTSTCSYDSSGECICGGPDVCGTDSYCNPTSKVGQRGDWVTLTVTRGSGPCPPGENCTSWRTVAADGTFTGSNGDTPVSGNLDDLDLMELKHLVNGPDLRNALKDGITCEQPPTDIGINVRLFLSTGALERDATGCVLTGPEGNVFQQIDLIIQRY